MMPTPQKSSLARSRRRSTAGAAAGRILVQGATSGDLNAMGESLGAAGGALAGGVTGAVTSSLSGVAGVADGFSN